MSAVCESRERKALATPEVSWEVDLSAPALSLAVVLGPVPMEEAAFARNRYRGPCPSCPCR